MSLPEDSKALKTMGFMKQKEPDLYSARLWVVGGRLTTGEVRAIADLADEFGRGELHLTTRQGVEIPWVPYGRLGELGEALEARGLRLGPCGPRVRTVTACQGLRCSHGLIDAQGLAERLAGVFYGRGGLPHKFKIGIAGCPNACIKPRENDLGVMGVARRRYDASLCTGCGLCVEACPVKCLFLEEGGGVREEHERCVECGECAFACPFGAWSIERTGFRIFVGGKMGKFPRLGRLAFEFVETIDEVVEIVERTLRFYAAHGRKGERFGDTLERVGLERYRRKVSLERVERGSA